MAVDKKFVKDGKVDYDMMNEHTALEEARKARDKLKDRLKLSSYEQKRLEDYMRSQSKHALSLHAKSQKNFPSNKPKSAIEAVEQGIKDANIGEMVKSRMERVNEAIDGPKKKR